MLLLHNDNHQAFPYTLPNLVSSMRFFSGLMLALLGIVLLWPATAADNAAEPITLEVPQFQLQMEPDSAAVIASADVDQLLIHLTKRPSQITPGSIFTKVNTDAANIIMTTTTLADGILCKLDLGHRAGFQLRKGRNSVEITFTDTQTRIHYASFLLQTAEDATTASTGARGPVKRIPIIPERAAADRYAVVVGISHYSDPSGGLTNLQFADRDARDFRDFLFSPDGGSFPKDNVRTLLNEDATSQNVRIGRA